MENQKPAKWIDPRTPVSVTRIGKYTVTIYDQSAYDASLRQYPMSNASKHHAKRTGDATGQLAKKKPASRYNWTSKLDKPLMGTVTNKDTSKESEIA